MVGKVFHPGVMGHGIDGGLFWLRARVLCFEMFGATLFDEDTPHLLIPWLVAQGVQYYLFSPMTSKLGTEATNQWDVRQD